VTGGSVTGQAGGVASVSKNGVTLQYRLQYSKDLMNWVDVTGAQPVTYDSASDLLRYVDPAGTNRQGFYRCRLSWTY
jgi:hypothetical protein